MPDVLVRDVDVVVLERLKSKAKRHNRSLQSELSVLLRRASEQEEPISRLELVRKIRSSIKNVQTTDSTELLREDRER
ncbi:MAG: hypothetical protein KA746_00460 [Pyrinomonadaceae bacterium]|nr:hypothetical protein [Pyrinomonadaceae bacterium]MBP6213982.1 hypothetical protein [Pyrinomonadaceae bacterium]